MNISDLTIEDISLQLDRSGRYIEGKVQIVITMKNNSKTSTYYVPKRPRIIDYDKAARTLSMGLHEPEPESEPEQVVILPDTTLQWQYLIPVWMKKITRPPGAREIVEVLNISDVQKVACTVAYHPRPSRVEPSDEREQTISASFERKLDGRD